jgi:hypothetical protein
MADPTCKAGQPTPKTSRVVLLQDSSTVSKDASSAYIKVGLIQGLQFIPPDYISRGRPHSKASPSLATSRAEIRVSSSREVEVPLDLLVLVLVYLVEVV